MRASDRGGGNRRRRGDAGSRVGRTLEWKRFLNRSHRCALVGAAARGESGDEGGGRGESVGDEAVVIGRLQTRRYSACIQPRPPLFPSFLSLASSPCSLSARGPRTPATLALLDPAPAEPAPSTRPRPRLALAASCATRCSAALGLLTTWLARAGAGLDIAPLGGARAALARRRQVGAAVAGASSPLTACSSSRPAGALHGDRYCLRTCSRDA